MSFLFVRLETQVRERLNLQDKRLCFVFLVVESLEYVFRCQCICIHVRSTRNLSYQMLSSSTSFTDPLSMSLRDPPSISCSLLNIAWMVTWSVETPAFGTTVDIHNLATVGLFLAAVVDVRPSCSICCHHSSVTALLTLPTYKGILHKSLHTIIIFHPAVYSSILLKYVCQICYLFTISTFFICLSMFLSLLSYRNGKPF